MNYSKIDLRLTLMVHNKQRPSKNYSKILQLRDVDINLIRHHVAARFYCNFYLVAVYYAPSMLNVSRSLNNS